MTKRIFWQKGMRLTEETFRKSDKCTAELVGKALALSAAGRFGLFPSRPFKISIDFDKNVIKVLSLNCLAITQDGGLIDVCYDTNHLPVFDTKAIIPSHDDKSMGYLLVIYAYGDEWLQSEDVFSEQMYKFGLVNDSSKVPSNALPLARIVYNEYCWRTDDVDFVPPCLYLSSLDEYEELANRFVRTLNELDSSLPENFRTGGNDALKVFWPVVQQLQIVMDKERDLMTPMDLLANVQKCVSSFVCACHVDEYIGLGEPEQFVSFVKSRYDFRNVYSKIREGLDLCSAIRDKVRTFTPIVRQPEPEPAPQPAPVPKKIRKKYIEI